MPGRNRGALLALVAAAALGAAAAHAAGNAYRLSVDGLACPYCAYGMEKKLRAVDGVEDIEFEIKAGAVIVTMAEGADLDEPAARRAVEAGGFTLRGFAPVPADEAGAADQ